MFRYSPLILVVAMLLPGTARAADGAATEEAAFDLLEFAVDGNTVLPAVTVEGAVYPFLGPGRDFKAIESARAALEKAYQDRGYLSASVLIPEQRIAGGVVRLQVMEGSVERLKVSGNRYTSRGDIRDQVPAVAAGAVPHFPALQEQLAGLNRGAERQVTPLLRPGHVPGKLEVELAVEDQLPLQANLELNNRQSPDTTATRLEAGVRYNNLFQRQHSLGLNYVVSPQKPAEVSVFLASYQWPLDRTRGISLSLQHSNSNIGAAADNVVVGKGTTLSARLSRQLPPVPGAPTLFHSLALGFDFKDLRETQNILGADSKVTPLRYLPLVGQYTAGSVSEAGDLLGNLSMIAGLRVFAREVNCQGIPLDQFDCRRYGSREDFSALRGDLSYTRRQLGWELGLRGDFQASHSALVSPEQFLGGGADSVRGYYEGEAAGDYGLRLRGEVKTPSLYADDATTVRAVAFLEGAWLRLKDALPGQTSRFNLGGAGLGLRLAAGKWGQVSVDVGHALRPGPKTDRGDLRAHARLRANF